MENEFLNIATKQFAYYKQIAEKAMDQLSEQDLFWKASPESNSIAHIAQHLNGNMLSRWTDFLTTDGEKNWRNRDSEFEDTIQTKNDLMQAWRTGWQCLFSALAALTEADLQKIIYIRNQGQTVMAAISRQLAHYPYHVGQIVFIAKAVVNQHWQSLSIPKNSSAAYNTQKFDQPKSIQHFTDEYLNKKS